MEFGVAFAIALGRVAWNTAHGYILRVVRIVVGFTGIVIWVGFKPPLITMNTPCLVPYGTYSIADGFTVFEASH
jgi:predicted tellurium resistance membrane protein TerC